MASGAMKKRNRILSDSFDFMESPRCTARLRFAFLTGSVKVAGYQGRRYWLLGAVNNPPQIHNLPYEQFGSLKGALATLPIRPCLGVSGDSSSTGRYTTKWLGPAPSLHIP